MARGRVLNLVMLAATISLVTVPLSGYLSDIFGRRRITAIGCALMIPWPFVYFALLDSGSGVLISLAILLSLPVHDLQYGPQAAFISETFPANLRYSGSSLGYQLASLTAGGPAPIIALTLYRKFGTSSAVAAYLSITGIISLISIGFLKKPYEEAASATSASPYKDQV
jgi:MFS family permease